MSTQKLFKEKTLYRTKQNFDEDRDDCSSRASTQCAPNLNRPKMNRSRGSAHNLSAAGSRASTAHTGAFKRSQDNINWHHLGEKIEDWFGYAKTPDQKVVYKFLNNLQRDDDQCSEFSDYRPESSVPTHVKTQSLEDILDNLKKYRQKFHGSKSARPVARGADNAALPKVSENSKHRKDKPSKPADLDQMFESSTWRVMRHLKSADIRNKYPLPKANPDFHFRNATVFHVAGRAPKSTFLLHPDWV